MIDDRDRIWRVIMARCGDVLSEADLALLGDNHVLPEEIADATRNALAEVETRLDELAELVAHAQEPDDDADRRRVGQAGA